MVLCGASVAPVFCETANNSSILDCREPQLKAINPIDIETLPTLQNLHRRVITSATKIWIVIEPTLHCYCSSHRSG
jgi:hypothetical protein